MYNIDMENKPKDICDECKTNTAQVSSYKCFNKYRRLCLDCYKKLLEEIVNTEKD